MRSDTIVGALRSRLLGSGEFDTGYPALDTALRLQFRLHYHLLGKGVNNVVAQVLKDECSKLENELRASQSKSVDANVSQLALKIVSNARGVISYHLGALNESKELLVQGAQVDIVWAGFAEFLNLENLYYRGLCNNDTAVYAEELSNVVQDIPPESHGMAWHYLQLIFKSMTRDQLKTLPADSALTYLGNLVNGYCDENQLLTLIDPLLKESKFPQANESNNKKLIQFHVFLQYFFKSSDTFSPKWYPFIVSSIEKTFQSIEISKCAMIYFGHQAEPVVKDSLLNFVNFVRYTERNFVINNENYDDVISLIDCFTFILNIVKNDSFNVSHVFNLSDSLDRLLSLLQFFYQKNNFSIMNENDSLNWLENSSKLLLPFTVSNALSDAWTILFSHKKSSLDLLLSNELTSYLANAMCVESSEGKLCDLQFQYSYLLAEKRLIPAATKILKTVILEKNPDCYKAWHLLALCESIREDKESAFKIVCSVIEAMKETLAEKKLSKIDRWQYIHLKLTQLSLIEEIFGTADALEMLPEIYELYGDLFPDDKDEFASFGKEINQSKNYLLQMIWIFAANMFLRAESKSESCKNAIKEAENVTNAYKNLNCNIARGYMYLTEGGIKRSLKEFESVLFYDQYNVHAVLGLAEIIFPDESNQSEPSFQNYCDLIPKEEHLATRKKVFVNELDESASCARLKFLLEYSITQSIDAYFTPEIWWYLSIIYNKFGDKSYKNALLNCIRYQETKPIREFKFCNF
ncbi:hypothetical protein HG535_0B00500 [Zygotorulaspora mrakii]|uniref:Cargo-transport protein YPP1 n=1 Tax=Zygotorulaspora mrakii TaxID=42260 RepID=A0A7H9AZH4_ZYGMR|nr:uncharacterized protein HG535_0B00500 [Zygotorulaspora mrakii]QLG71012.1 hypothetical protein HG535_0B00500 [Zygotorulaspora mrakii]